MKKKILCTMMSMVMVASYLQGAVQIQERRIYADTSKTKEAGTTISVAT